MLSARYLNRLPNEVVSLFSELEVEILTDICKRLEKANYSVTSSAEWQVYKLKQLGYTQKEINKIIGKYMGKSTKLINKIMLEATMYSYDNESLIYKRAKKEGVNLGHLVDFKDAPQLQSVLDAGIKQTQWEMQNFTRTLGMTVSNQFIQALDLAWLQVQSGAFTTQQAVRKAVLKLSQDGVSTVDYMSGRSDKLDVAVRRAVVTGCNKTSAEISLKRMDDMGADLVITTSHVGARPNHQAWQGKVFSYSGTSDKYPSFRQATGYGTAIGLAGVNCRHSFYPYIEGISSNTMQDIDKEKNDKLYEAEQQQRYIERQIRKWKRMQQSLDAVGYGSSREKAKVREWQKRQRDHIDKWGLQRQYDREAVV